jgi:hypothetical protein
MPYIIEGSKTPGQFLLEQWDARIRSADYLFIIPPAAGLAGKPKITLN